MLQDVKKIGRKFDIKDVSDGYARNFLISKKLAIPADDSALRLKAEMDRKDQEAKASAVAAVRKLSGEILEFKVRSGDKGEVFGSVTEADIKKSLEAKGYQGFSVDLDHSLRFLGDRDVDLVFGKGIKGKVRVRLLPQS
ncbi:MAG: large subunit ribosomal protein L9 [Parcubacteria group bacterium Gr01-1014_19]|nr:MAG: large subunit ribosomal protein L9 [Parcubacteria group bacterium Gr01-1014_19]